MFNSQIEFSKVMIEIYKFIFGCMFDLDFMKIEGNLEGIQVCEEYEVVVKELQEMLVLELDMIEIRVICFVIELFDVIKVIWKIVIKCEYKKFDYD